MDNSLDVIKDALPYIIPLLVVEIVLLFWAVFDLDRRKNITSKSKMVWMMVIIFFGIIGPIFYFIFGRRGKVVNRE
ncbi:MAG: PLDc N-terminal domain-containing protein [Dehalococcoidales bacterium]|jgi:hypothetical protein